MQKYISKDYDRDKNEWYLINGMTGFIAENFYCPSYQEVHDIALKVGALEAGWLGYGFNTEEDALNGIDRLYELVRIKGTKCYKKGHVFNEDAAERGGFADCKICYRSIGWVCEKREPIGMCEYRDTDKMHDGCVHCGEPEEGK